tara:strand:+ start:3932 stop:6400 length:2469 start_codon:yes stop_codon:yes gene_type:complete
MSLIKIYDNYVEKFSLTLHPETRYVSSSLAADMTTLPTGSVMLSSRPSKCFKNIVEPEQAGENSYDPESSGIPGFNEGDFEYLIDLENAATAVAEQKASGSPESLDVSATLKKVLSGVNNASEIARNTKRFEIVRFDPPFSFKLNTSVKNCVRNVLMPFYAPYYDVCQFSYTNYHTVNFFTGALVPDSSAIIYPNLQLGFEKPRPYSPSGSFSFDFYINPRYTNDKSENVFRAGTILHLSSTYAISLVSGTSRDNAGKVDGYRILLQLSHSADIAPSSIDLTVDNNKRSRPQDLIFLSKDNLLKRNNWHHVAIRWGTKNLNDGTGSIRIDDTATSFNINSGTILPPSHVQSSALVVGNYFDGYGDEARFFNDTSSAAEGVFPTLGDGGALPDPTNFKFNHALNAEIHDIKIYNKRLSDTEIEKNKKYGNYTTDDLMFYVPPYFVEETKTRDTLITPFQTQRSSSIEPFNPVFSFGVGGYIMNLPNFLREFKHGAYPRLWHLTASTIDTTVLDITANGYIYSSGSTRKRNLTILPNDNGLFIPDYELLNSGSKKTSMSRYKNVYGGVDFSLINIDDMIPTSSAYFGLPTVTARDVEMAQQSEAQALEDDISASSIISEIAGVSPESLGGNLGPILTIYQRTRDPSSNEISIFDISNLYYGNRILPDTFYLTDPSLTGSGGKVKMTISDNGKGSLYRADSLTPHAKWANVGNVLYEEGIALIKSPHISYFGQDRFEASFKGEQNVHILTINLPADVGTFNSSSNPQYKVLSASTAVNDTEARFVYITGINLHDDNLNVIMRANLAQPVLKRESDEVLFKFKTDF